MNIITIIWLHLYSILIMSLLLLIYLFDLNIMLRDIIYDDIYLMLLIVFYYGSRPQHLLLFHVILRIYLLLIFMHLFLHSFQLELSLLLSQIILKADKYLLLSCFSCLITIFMYQVFLYRFTLVVWCLLGQYKLSRHKSRLMNRRLFIFPRILILQMDRISYFQSFILLNQTILWNDLFVQLAILFL